MLRFVPGRRVSVSSVAAALFIGLILWPAAASGGDSSPSVAVPLLSGDLDPSFGSGGVVSHAPAEAIVVQPDRKIVVVGSSLARYLPNGSPDTTFGDGGYVQTPLGGQAAGESAADAVALQPDGKIVVAGVRYSATYPGSEGIESEFALARYNPDGSLDTSFGSDGIVNTVIPGEPNQVWNARADALTILPGGHILAAGLAYSQDCCSGTTAAPFALAEYKSDGSLDSTFGEGGIVQTAFAGGADATSLAMQPDGKIVATGPDVDEVHGADVFRMALARYEPDGSLDSAFGTAGKVETSDKIKYVGGPSALQKGKIVIAGSHSNVWGSALFPVVARFGPRGRVDPTFGKHGYVDLRSLPGDSANALVTQPNGKILVATGSAVFRLTPNGRLDPSFGRRGSTTLGSGVGPAALAVQADGNVLVGGQTLARLIGGNNCFVPALRGKTVSRARAKLKASYCSTGRISRLFSNRISRGNVISTAPLPGDRRPAGTKVDLLVSRGRPTHRS